MPTELLISLVAAVSSLFTVALTNAFGRSTRRATADHTTVQTMELLVKNLRLELDRERSYRQELETRVRHLETQIRELHGDGR